MAMMAGEIVRRKTKLHQLVEEDPEKLQKYCLIFEAFISDGSVSEDERFLLKQYRMIKHVDDSMHNQILRCSGWTPLEFVKGYRNEDAAEDAVDDDSGFVGGSDSGGATAAAAEAKAAAAAAAAAAANAAEAPRRRSLGSRRSTASAPEFPVSPPARASLAPAKEGGAAPAFAGSGAAMMMTVLKKKSDQAKARQNKKVVDKVAKVREILIYCIFMVCFTIATTAGLSDEHNYKYASQVRACVCACACVCVCVCVCVCL